LVGRTIGAEEVADVEADLRDEKGVVVIEEEVVVVNDEDADELTGKDEEVGVDMDAVTDEVKLEADRVKLEAADIVEFGRIEITMLDETDKVVTVLAILEEGKKVDVALAVLLIPGDPCRTAPQTLLLVVPGTTAECI